MTISYQTYVVEQDLRLPRSLHEWLTEGHLAYFFSDTVDALDLSAFRLRYENGGPRNQPFHPAMMVNLLLHGYYTGVFSSRKLARKLHGDVAFRVLAADNFTAHRTLSEFRAIHLEEFADLFVQVLKLASECGLVKLGTVAVYGTELKANASRHKAEAELKEQIKSLLDKASATDAAEEHAPDLDISDEIELREKRLATITAAKERLEARQRETDREKDRNEDDDQQQRNPDGSTKGGPKYKRPFCAPEGNAQENFTDYDSRIMKHGNGAIEQCYNGQAAVDAGNQIIAAAELTHNAADSAELPVMLDAVNDNLEGLPEQTLADAGYRSEVVLEWLSGLATNVSMALGRECRSNLSVNAEKYPHTAQKAEKLQSPAAQQLYLQRKQVVEPPNGWIKSVLGFRQFSLRGMDKSSCEWKLECIAMNLRRMAYL